MSKYEYLQAFDPSTSALPGFTGEAVSIPPRIANRDNYSRLLRALAEDTVEVSPAVEAVLDLDPIPHRGIHGKELPDMPPDGSDRIPKDIR